MTRRYVAVAATLLLCSVSAFGQANPIGAAVAESIKATLIGRGLSATDPRVTGTVTQVSQRLLSVAAANSASGFTWLSAMGRLLPYAGVALAVGGGLVWLFNSSGDQVTVVGANGAVLGAFAMGQMVYRCGPGSVFASSAVGCISEATFRYLGWHHIRNISYPPISASLVLYTNQMQYGSDSTWHDNYGQWGYGIALEASPVGCAGGQVGVLTGGTWTCTGRAAPVDHVADPVAYVPLPTAYSSATTTQQQSPLSPEMVAELANRLWRDAASQPGYSGEPWAAGAPVTAGSVPASTGALVSHLAEPVQLGNPLPETSSAPSTPVDLGPNPDTPETQVPEAPDFYAPLLPLLAGIQSWAVPAHAATCPVWHAEPTISGHVFVIDTAEACVLFEQHRALVFAISVAAWAAVAFFIVLDA